MEIIDDNFALITTTDRNIGGIIPHVTIEEHHTDRLSVTEHPVAIGAAVADHSFRNPAELTMRVGWSNSSARTYGFVQQEYELLLQLQQSRMPFNVSTGKRLYTSMLLTELDVVTDETSESALMVTAIMREVILVGTAQTTNGIGSPASQSSPQDTQAPIQGGTLQPQPSPYGDLSGVYFP